MEIDIKVLCSEMADFCRCFCQFFFISDWITYTDQVRQCDQHNINDLIKSPFRWTSSRPARAWLSSDIVFDNDLNLACCQTVNDFLQVVPTRENAFCLTATP